MPIDVTFLEQGTAGQPEKIATALAEFISSSNKTLHIAIYDFRLKKATLADPVVQALRDRAAAGVEVRIAYDQGKPQGDHVMLGSDPAPAEAAGVPGTADFIQSIGGGVQSKAIKASPQLMHNKYVIRDGHTMDAALWTGSTNFTDDAWNLQENNILRIHSPILCALYETDFSELWSSGAIHTTGANDAGQATVDGILVEADFSPGDGRIVDQDISWVIGAATRRIRISSMVISSGTILGALSDIQDRGGIDFEGIYDGTQMAGVLKQWAKANNPKADVFKKIAASLASKHSTPFTPTSRHDFMHNKIVVVDDIVVTGSFNFSNNAAKNAENVLTIHDATLANTYAGYIDGLVAKYGGAPA
jgi:phosphatidylserine/phosphatidylglycerophosphate/cardiolipin synthase-like enzyme